MTEKLRRAKAILADAKGMLTGIMTETTNMCDRITLELQIDKLRDVIDQVQEVIKRQPVPVTRQQLHKAIVELATIGCYVREIIWVMREQLELLHPPTYKFTSSLQFEQYYNGLVVRILRSAGVSFRH